MRSNPFIQVYTLKSKDDFIQRIKDLTYINSSEMNTISRPEHVLAVYYLGNTIIKKVFGNLMIPTNDNRYISYVDIWKYTAILHDIGYSQNCQSIDNYAEYNANLLTTYFRGYTIDYRDRVNEHWAKAYTTEELIAYYYYRDLVYSKESEQYTIQLPEIHEHGLLGAFLASKLLSNNVPAIYKTSDGFWGDLVLATTLSIAQHNIWRIDNKDLNNYKCIFNLPNVDKKKFMYKHNKLSTKLDILSFNICLIDTLEISKKLYIDNELKDYALFETVLKEYYVDVRPNKKTTSIIIYTDGIREALHNSNDIVIYHNWVNSVKSMKEFMRLDVFELKDKIIIKIPYVKKNLID